MHHNCGRIQELASSTKNSLPQISSETWKYQRRPKWRMVTVGRVFCLYFNQALWSLHYNMHILMHELTVFDKCKSFRIGQKMASGSSGTGPGKGRQMGWLRHVLTVLSVLIFVSWLRHVLTVLSVLICTNLCLVSALNQYITSWLAESCLRVLRWFDSDFYCSAVKYRFHNSDKGEI